MNSQWIEHLPQWYLQWCWDNEELQAWWRETWPATADTGHGSNVEIGDRFTLGRNRQACLVQSKIYNIAIKPEPDYITYGVGGDCGGYMGRQRHDGVGIFEGGHGLFIPNAEQLKRLGHAHIAIRLLDDLEPLTSKPCRCLLAYRESRGQHATGCPRAGEPWIPR